MEMEEVIIDKLFKMLVKAYSYRVLSIVCAVYALIKTDNMLVVALLGVHLGYLGMVIIDDIVSKTVSFEKTFCLCLSVKQQQLLSLLMALVMLWQIFMANTLNEYIAMSFSVAMQFAFGSYIMKDMLWVRGALKNQ